MSLLQQELERSFGEGPAHRSVEETVRSGRRALRRRRVGVAAGALAVFASIGAGYAISSAGPDAPRSGEVVTDPTPSPTPTVEPGPTWEDNTPVRYVDRVLQIRDGVVVHEHIENPFDYQPPRVSDALDLTFEGERQWVIIESKSNGYGYSASAPSNGWASFADYVADQIDGTTGATTAGRTPSA